MTKVWDYIDEYNEESKEILAAVERVFRSGRLILGQEVEQFEQELALYCGSSFGVGVNSCTDALFLGLKALGVEKGDEVITVANTAVPTVSAIVSAGGIPVFVDIHPENSLMDVGQIAGRITSKTKVILPVHLYGQCVDMDPLMKIAEEHNLSVLEDCAQATGAMYGENFAGSIGNLSAFSFYPTKVLGGYGDGGMVLTKDPVLDEKLRSLRFYGMKSTYYAEEHGYNSRLDELHAAILRFKLQKLDSYVVKRRELACRYFELLSDTPLSLLAADKSNFHVYYVFVARHPKRDLILERLREREVFLNISYPWPIHTMRAYEHFGWKEGDLPETEAAAKEIFSLPMYPSLSFEEQEQFCTTLKEVLDGI